MDAEEVADDGWENEVAMYEVESMKVSNTPKSWYYDLRYYLSTSDVPIGLDAQKRRVLHLKFARYQPVSRILFQKKIDNDLLKYLEKEES